MIAPRALLATLTVELGFCALTLDDTAVLVQKVVQQEHLLGKSGGTAFAGEATEATPLGPVAHTLLGSVRGVHMDGYDVFKGVPYVERPARFARSKPKKPWAPELLNATEFGPGCIGAHTSVPENENCLNLNIWLPPGGLKNMPVIVYFHGGINQHGSGQEPLRHGDLIVQSKKFPTIFVNFDYRLGIFGWIYGRPGSNITNNLGFLDQQEGLRWVQKNIAHFGGDPTRVTLQGQSEGCGTILAHMVAPGSMSLFHRAAMHSPPADMWSRTTNELRTNFVITRLGCQRKDTASTLRCLSQKNPQKLWNGDWVSEELSRNIFSPPWFSNFFGLMQFAGGKNIQDLPGTLGWHPVVDGEILPGEPRELIRQGKWNKIPVLITVSPNETLGVFPGGKMSHPALMMGFSRLLKPGTLGAITARYKESLQAQGIHLVDEMDLNHQMMTDKMWTCDCRSLAHDIAANGGEAHLGMFWHKPKWDPVGRSTNKICEHGATCHAAEMMYVLPQGRGCGVHGPGMEKELEFVYRYADEFLSFVHGEKNPWVPYDIKTQPMTFYNEDGARVVPGYRKEQCDILDSSMGDGLPSFMRSQGEIELHRE